jgi:type III restriction enzyme
VVDLKGGEHLIVEIKGQLGDAMLKKAAAERWCRAVTNDRQFGRWTYYLCFGAGELKDVLNAHATSAVSV